MVGVGVSSISRAARKKKIFVKLRSAKLRGMKTCKIEFLTSSLTYLHDHDPYHTPHLCSSCTVALFEYVSAAWHWKHFRLPAPIAVSTDKHANC